MSFWIALWSLLLWSSVAAFGGVTLFILAGLLRSALRK